MQRVVEPEWLDEMPADDARAVRSRSDLRRLNWLMAHVSILARELRRTTAPKRVIDVGCGDGALALRLAQAAGWRGCEVVLLDRQAIISPRIKEGFMALGCHATAVSWDVLDGLQAVDKADLVFTNLFLHHFQEAELSRLLRDLSGLGRTFAACEPRRSSRALLGSRVVGLMGANAVTRHDAVASVRAGFCGQELSQLWPDGARWSLRERPAGWFSHCFTAHRL